MFGKTWDDGSRLGDAGLDGASLTSVSAPRTKSHASFTRLVPICMRKYPTSAQVASIHRASPPPVVASADPTRKGTVAAVSVLGRAAETHPATPPLTLDDLDALGLLRGCVASPFPALAAARANLRSMTCLLPLDCVPTVGEQRTSLLSADQLTWARPTLFQIRC